MKEADHIVFNFDLDFDTCTLLNLRDSGLYHCRLTHDFQNSIPPMSLIYP